MPRMAARKVITAAMVDKLKPAPKGTRIEHWDAVVPGFGLRVTDAGGKSFFLRTRVNGEQLRMSWPYSATSLEAARAAAKAVLGEVEQGIDPKAKRAAEQAEKAEVASHTFKVVAERFMRQHVEPRLAANTQKEYKWALFGQDTAAWANKPIAAITRANVRSLLEAIMESNRPASANKMLAYLSKFFNWCAEMDLLQVPPTDRIKKPAVNVIGERTLNHAEVVEVWAAFEAEGGLFGDLFKLLLLTGQRRSETAGMRLAELFDLDGEKPTWEIPSSRTKNSRPHAVPLSPQVVDIIKARPLIGDLGLLLTTTGTTPTTGFSNAKERVDAWIAKRRKEAGERPMPNWRLHDLRRTMVTMMNEHLGIAPHVVEACVNHVSGLAKAGVAGVYNKALYLEDRRRAFEAWDGYLKGIVTPDGETSNVVNLRG